MLRRQANVWSCISNTSSAIVGKRSNKKKHKNYSKKKPGQIFHLTTTGLPENLIRVVLTPFFRPVNTLNPFSPVPEIVQINAMCTIGTKNQNFIISYHQEGSILGVKTLECTNSLGTHSTATHGPGFADIRLQHFAMDIFLLRNVALYYVQTHG